MKNKFYNEIKNIVGSKNVLEKKKDKAAFVTGWRAYDADCEIVITPTKLLQMWEVLNVLNKYNKIILIQASNTSLTGGSTPFGEYDRELVIINTLKLNKIFLINNAQQIIAFPGSTLYKLERYLKPFNRAPHSEIGSSCIGASIIGGICNSSGGALIKRGPAYTELSVFAKINRDGQLTLVNKLGIDLGNTPKEILNNLENKNFPNNWANPENKKASSTEYKETVKNVEANTPARYNSNKSKLYESSGCSGKIAVFAARIDTFKKEESETTLYLSTNKPEDFTNFKKSVLSNLENLPIYAEYMHKDAYEAAKKYGKDAFLLIYFLGTSTMPIFYKIKTRIERYFKSSKIFNSKSLDYILNILASALPSHLPKIFDSLNKKFVHHLIFKCDTKDLKEITKITDLIFNKEYNNIRVCDAEETKKIILNRFVFAGATARLAILDKNSNSEILALDVAHRRNQDDWDEVLPKTIADKIHKSLHVGHFFCNVFHREYAVKKGSNNNAVKQMLLDRLDKMGAKFPAEHNVGHLYKAEPNHKEFFKSLDPTNSFNPGIGQMSKKSFYGKKK